MVLEGGGGGGGVGCCKKSRHKGIMTEAEMDPKEYGKNEKVHKEREQEDRDEELWRNGKREVRKSKEVKVDGVRQREGDYLLQVSRF